MPGGAERRLRYDPASLPSCSGGRETGTGGEEAHPVGDF